MANGHGGVRKGAGRKSKAEELKLLESGKKAIEKVYGSLDNYWLEIATQSKDSFPHMKMLTEYLYGKPSEEIDVTSQGEQIQSALISFFNNERDKD